LPLPSRGPQPALLKVRPRFPHGLKPAALNCATPENAIERIFIFPLTFGWHSEPSRGTLW